MYLTAEIQQRADLRAKLAEQMSAFSDYGRNYLNKKKMLNEAWT